MSTQPEREGYRNRITLDDIVYFVEGESVIGAGQLTVKKGSITQADSGRRYPLVAIWDNPSINPKGLSMNVAKSPRELFTPQEIGRLLNQAEGPLGADPRTVDELMVDPLARTELIGLLGEKSLSRLMDDHLRNPGDPEY